MSNVGGSAIVGLLAAVARSSSRASLLASIGAGVDRWVPSTWPTVSRCPARSSTFVSKRGNMTLVAAASARRGVALLQLASPDLGAGRRCSRLRQSGFPRPTAAERHHARRRGDRCEDGADPTRPPASLDRAGRRRSRQSVLWRQRQPRPGLKSLRAISRPLLGGLRNAHRRQLPERGLQSRAARI